MADAKRHHFLPQLYLRHFADAKERFYQIEKTHEPKAILTKVFKAGFQSNYHTLDWSDRRSDRNTVENLLSKVELRQAQMLKALSADPSSLDEWRVGHPCCSIRCCARPEITIRERICAQNHRGDNSS
jgi:Protein of unknown function (DUF4238)